jgi:hypothetical protein
VNTDALGPAERGAASLPSSGTSAPSSHMDTDDVLPPLPDLPSAATEPISGPLRPASEVLLEELIPTSPLVRRRAFGSLLRVLLSSRGD